jgi:hypothetical protein
MNLTPAGAGQALIEQDDVPNDFELSYPLLADYIFDRSVIAKYLTAYAIIFQQVGIATIALTLFGNMVSPIVAAGLQEGEWIGRPSSLILIVSVFFVFPLCSLQYMDHLRYAGAFQFPRPRTLAHSSRTLSHTLASPPNPPPLRFASYIANAFTLFLIVALFGASCYELGHRPADSDTHGWTKTETAGGEVRSLDTIPALSQTVAAAPLLASPPPPPLASLPLLSLLPSPSSASCCCPPPLFAAPPCSACAQHQIIF